VTHGESEFREVEAVFPPRLQGFVRAQSQCGLTSQRGLWLGEWSDNTSRRNGESDGTREGFIAAECWAESRRWRKEMGVSFSFSLNSLHGEA
jgi:hypothetical protein